MEIATSADGTGIAFDRTGDGPALVLVGGALSTRGAAAGIAAHLAARFTVVSYDRRGRGDSGDTPPYAVSREVEDLAGVMEATGAHAVYGHSSGAIVALEATVAGVPVHRLAVYEPPYILEGTRSRTSGLDGRVAALVDEGRRGDAVKLFLSEAVQLPDEVVAGAAASPAWPSMEAIAPTLVYDLTLAGDNLIPERLSSVAVPVLAVDGGDSAEWMRAAVAAVAATIPGCRYVTLPGQGHGAADAALAPVLAEFFG